MGKDRKLLLIIKSPFNRIAELCMVMVEELSWVMDGESIPTIESHQESIVYISRFESISESLICVPGSDMISSIYWGIPGRLGEVDLWG